MSNDSEIVQNDAETYDYTCAECGFVSEGHTSKKSATERRSQHLSEHEGDKPAPLAQPAE